MTAGALTSLAPLTYGSYSTSWISVERHELQLPKWDADGFRVAVLADLHANTSDEGVQAANAIRIAIAEKPDLIAIPGDFVNRCTFEYLEYLRQALEPLHDAECPVVATLGNHDYATHEVSKIFYMAQSASATVLRNEAIEVSGVTVAGIDDGLFGKHRFGFLNDENQSRSVLALFHEPDFVKYVPEKVSLQLSGHSHGGQICLPGGRSLHTPVGALKYISGYYPKAKVPLYVTRGVGTVGPRLRLFCRPEVTVLTLRSA